MTGSLRLKVKLRPTTSVLGPLTHALGREGKSSVQQHVTVALVALPGCLGHSLQMFSICFLFLFLNIYYLFDCGLGLSCSMWIFDLNCGDMWDLGSDQGLTWTPCIGSIEA